LIGHRAAGVLFALAVFAGSPAGAVSTPSDQAQDALLTPPPPWADRVAPIPRQRLDELPDANAVRIRETRDRIAAMLGASATAPGDLAAAYGRLGALYAAHRLYAGAEPALGNARALDPAGFAWAWYTAHIALEQGEAGQALTALGAAARIDPDYPVLPLRRGEALLGLNRLDEARAAYTQAAARDGLRAAALFGLAQIDLLQRDWAASAAGFEEVLRLQPNATAARYPLSQALVRLGRRDEAREQLARRGPVKPTWADPLVDELRSLQAGARYRFERAIAAVSRRDYETAVEEFAAGLAEQPENPRARTSHARALWIVGREADAEAELRHAIADGPDETLPRFLLAVVEDARGNADAAMAGYRAVLERDPEHAGASSYMANLALRRGDYTLAADRFARAIDAGAIQMPVYLHYWSALARAGAPERELHDRLVAFDERFPEPPLFRYLLARLLLNAQDPQIADTVRALEIATGLQAAQAVPPHAELLARALAANGEFERARALQDDLVEIARLSGAWAQAALLEKTAAAYRAGEVPAADWPPSDPMLMPPPVDPEPVMRNYPAGQPY
jgi:predicted Zn-dependent protease